MRSPRYGSHDHDTEKHSDQTEPCEKHFYGTGIGGTTNRHVS